MPIAPEYLHMVFPGVTFEALLYGRNSHDPSGKGRSVDSQIGEGKALCDAYDWHIKGVYDKDIGRSASRHAKRRRDDFEALLEAIETKEGNIVVAFEASRYYRDLEAYVRLRKACTDAGALLCYNGQIYDLSKSADRSATAFDALKAEAEAEAIRDRNLRGQRTRNAAGRPGGRTPYGYQRRYDPDSGELVDQVLHPVRAEYVREIFRRFDSGKSLYSMITWLNAIPEAAHPSGKPWAHDRLRLILGNPTYIGKRHTKGEIVGDGTWAPLITDEALWHRVQARLKDPARRTMRDSQVAHLMSGLALCGECPDEPHLTTRRAPNGARIQPSGERPRVYICSVAYHTAIMELTMDAYVEEAVLTFLHSKEARAVFEAPDARAKAADAEVLLGQLNAQLREARVMAATFGPDGRPALSLASLASQEALLAPQIAKAEATAAGSLAAGLSPSMRALLNAPSEEALEAMWDALELPEQRDVLRRVVTVRLFRARVRGARKLEPGRIKLAFRGDPAFKGKV